MEPSLLRADAVARGWSDRELRSGIATGVLTRPMHGVYVESSTWNAAHHEDQQRVLAHSVARRSRSRTPVFSHITAAALWGLPLYRVGDRRCHVINVDGSDSPSVTMVVRHDLPCPADDRETLDGLRVTSLSRTVSDVIRSVPLPAALAVADAALRRASVAHGRRVVDMSPAARLRDELRSRLEDLTGARGVRQARVVLELADARAESPGESASRLFLHQLGFRPIGLQVPVPSERGSTYEVDFEFQGVLGEFDGAQKYKGSRFLHGRTPEQAVIAEKRREDWIRARRQQPLIRWGMDEIESLETFRAFLRSTSVVAMPQRLPLERASFHREGG